MTHPTYTKFKGITSLYEDQLNENLLYGMIDFLDWASLNIGAFVNVTRNPIVSGVYGGDKSRLRPVEDPRYTNGCVWESFRQNWVWESGLDYATQPINISGIYISNVFYPVGTTGTYDYYIDYPNGRVVFTNALATTTNVGLEYSYKNIKYTSADYPWVRELMFETQHLERPDYFTMESGMYSQLSDIRTQMPIVAVELGLRNYKPYQLGGGQWIRQDCIFYILSESSTDNHQLCDILSNQSDKVIWIPNRKLMKEDSEYPHSLDYRGAKVSSPKQFPDLVAPTGDGGFQWRNVQFLQSRVVDMGPLYVRKANETILSTKLFRGIVHHVCEVPMWNI